MSMNTTDLTKNEHARIEIALSSDHCVAEQVTDSINTSNSSNDSLQSELDNRQKFFKNLSPLPSISQISPTASDLLRCSINSSRDTLADRQSADDVDNVHPEQTAVLLESPQEEERTPPVTLKRPQVIKTQHEFVDPGAFVNPLTGAVLDRAIKVDTISCMPNDIIREVTMPEPALECANAKRVSSAMENITIVENENNEFPDSPLAFIVAHDDHEDENEISLAQFLKLKEEVKTE